MAEANTTMGDSLESRAATRRSSRRRRPCGSAESRRRIIDDDDDDDEDDFAPAPPKPPSPKPDASMSDLFGADSDEEQTEKDEAHKMEDLFGLIRTRTSPPNRSTAWRTCSGTTTRTNP